MRPAASSAAAPGGTVFPANPSQWYGTSVVAPDGEGQLDRLAGVHVADDPARLALLVTTVDREQRDVDPEGGERSGQLGRDDRVACVIDRPAGVCTDDVADKARPTADGASVPVRVLHGHAVERRHDVEVEPVEIDRVVRLHGDRLSLGNQVLDERDERSGQHDAHGGRALEDDAAETKGRDGRDARG